MDAAKRYWPLLALAGISVMGIILWRFPAAVPGVLIALVCPAMMLFMMRGMHHGAHHGHEQCHDHAEQSGDREAASR